MAFQLLGVGSPLVDYSLSVSEKFLSAHSPCSKGATAHISQAEKDTLLNCFDGTCLRTPGGSAANTLRTFTALGGSGALFGKAGNDDDGRFFCDALYSAGTENSLIFRDKSSPTGYCLTLVTPDGERTMLSDLGASLNINTEEVKKIDFSNYSFVLLEGYLIREKWIPELVDSARRAGCRIALDLNNFEMVNRYRESFLQIINSGIFLLLANDAEMQSLFPGKNRNEIIGSLQQKVPLALFKLGQEGALIVEKTAVTAIPAIKTAVKDTTGAGDFFAAGFFYGLSRKMAYPLCGRLGTLCAGAIIAEKGTLLSDENFNLLKYNINKEVQNELQS